MTFILPFPEIGPNIFSIELFGYSFALRWYAMAYIVGLLLGWRIAVWAIKRPALWPDKRAPVNTEQIEELLTACIIGVVLGGRLGFVLFYRPDYFLQYPIEIVKIWKGGMAFHGGLLGVALAAAWFCRKHKISPWQIGDILALAAPAGIMLGRLANFINGELWGRAATVPWAMVFPDPRSHSCPGVEGLCARHPSQLYEAALEGLLLGLILLVCVTRFRAFMRPGQTMGLFLIGYGTARFIVEFFRQADIQFITPENPLGWIISIGPFGVTMGQLLSLPMIVLGLVIFSIARRRRHDTA